MVQYCLDVAPDGVLFAEGAIGEMRADGQFILDGGETALHLAARRGHVAICAILLEHEAYRLVNNHNVDGETVLHWAGHADVCRLLLEHEGFTEVNAVNAFGWTALHMAASDGEYETCEALLGSPRFLAADLRDVLHGFSALDRAACGGHHRVCGLLRSAPQFTAVDGDLDGRTALHHAVCPDEDVSTENRLETCRELLAYEQLDVNARDWHGRTALDCAILSRCYDVCHCLLMDPRIDVAKKDGKHSPLFEVLKAAVTSGTPDLETAQLVIEDERLSAAELNFLLFAHPAEDERLSAAELNASDPDTGGSILHDCCDDDAVCSVLLRSARFTAANHVDFMGQTALHTAARRGNLRTCAALLADPVFSAVEAKDNDGMTAEECSTPDAKLVFQNHRRLST